MPKAGTHGALAQGAAVPVEWDDDQALVEAVRRRDQRAYAALFSRYGAHVHHVLLHLLGAEPEVADLLHDVFVIAIERIDELENVPALRAWLSGIAVYSTRSYIRRRRLRSWIGLGRAAEVVPAPRPGASPDVAVALRLAYATLDRLPADERIAFALRNIHGMRLDEVADCCGVSLATIKRRLSRAEASFRALAARHPLLAEWLARRGS